MAALITNMTPSCFDRQLVLSTRLISLTVPVWPQTSNNPTALVDVARMLLTEALKVPHNQQFLLLSDACVPLYPPQARVQLFLTSTYLPSCAFFPAPRQHTPSAALD